MLALAIRYQYYARQVTALAALVCFVSVVLYGALLLITVQKAAGSQNYESQARDIGNALGMLETQYLAASGAITPAKVKDYGLVTVPASRIAYQAADAEAVSMR